MPSARAPHSGPAPTDDLLPFARVLDEELTAILGDARTSKPSPPTEPGLYEEIHKLSNDPDGEPLSALCLSGGGIRSATFSLGVLQGLASVGLLDRFAYLSTVSGGGYIGSWLTGWIHRKAQADPAADPYVQIRAELAGGKIEAGRDGHVVPEPPAVTQLREYSQYLAPRSGFISADFWALIATVLRNVMLNWFVLIPVLAAALALPRLLAALVWNADPRGADVPMGIGFLACAWTVGWVSRKRVLQVKTAGGRTNRPNQGAVVAFGIVPLWGAAVCLSVGWACRHLSADAWVDAGLTADMGSMVLFGIGVMVVGWLGYVVSLGTDPEGVDWELAPSGLEYLAEFVVYLMTGAVGGVILRLAAHAFDGTPLSGRHDLQALVYATTAPGLFIISFTTAAVIFVGLGSKLMRELDREWLSRFGAWALITVVAWVGVSAVVLLLPVAIADATRWWRPAMAAAATGGSGLMTILGGLSKRTIFKPKGQQDRRDGSSGNRSETDDNSWFSRAVKIALPVFVVLFVVGLSLATDLFVSLANATTSAPFDFMAFARGFPGVHTVLAHDLSILIVGVSALLLGTGASWLVGINKFSLHAMYRNRLIRAYLGASRGRPGVSQGNVRRPDPFIGFDPDDDFALCDSAPKNRPRRLFHVINMALNLVGGEELAWQERKAESMTASSLHVGTYALDYRRASEYASRRRLRDRKSHPLTIGTAMAISGAAASPNMGYHSSPVLSFLLTLFNARLGWWLGNPGKYGQETYKLESPAFALQPLLAEAFGRTDRTHPYVYASDGGHFENLGLYEMVRRRCRFILVVDAGADPACSYEDLSGAIRKVRSDMGISIEVPDEAQRGIFSRSNTPVHQHGGRPPELRIAFLGTIRYSDVDAKESPLTAAVRQKYDGVLVYIKPAFYNTKEPLDVVNYANTHTTFPHETTADQFFSESQFESYRALGLFAVGRMCETIEGRPGTPFQRFLASVRTYVNAAPAREAV